MRDGPDLDKMIGRLRKDVRRRVLKQTLWGAALILLLTYVFRILELTLVESMLLNFLIGYGAAQIAYRLIR